MPDPSAGRPSTPEEQFTDEDVELIANAMFVGNRVHAAEGLTTPAWCELATVALAALAAANRLLPASSEHREEWGIVWRGPHGGVVMTDEALPSRLQAEILGRRRVGTYDIASFTVRRREHRMFDDGSTLTGPWTEVDGSPTDV